MSTLDESLQHQLNVTLHSKTMREKIKRKRKKRSIKKLNPHTQAKQLLRFELATLIGNCRWTVWSHYRNGQPHEMSAAEIYQPGWAIRSAELIVES